MKKEGEITRQEGERVKQLQKLGEEEVSYYATFFKREFKQQLLKTREFCREAGREFFPNGKDEVSSMERTVRFKRGGKIFSVTMHNGGFLQIRTSSSTPAKNENTIISEELVLGPKTDQNHPFLNYNAEFNNGSKAGASNSMLCISKARGMLRDLSAGVLTRMPLLKI